jgi:small conductance mechanosensitive channel
MMENEIVQKIVELLAVYGVKVLAAVVILVIGRFVAIGIRSMITKIMEKQKVDDMLVSFVSSISYIVLMAFVVVAALDRLGIQTTSFIAILGAAGLAIGLALQGSLANFASGVLMIIFKPFKCGDFIEGGGISGIVEGITIFTTEMKTPDNKKIIVPNGKIMSDNIVNYSAKDTRRIDMTVGVSYSDDLDKVKRVLEDILASDERVLDEPAPTIGVAELADSSINFVVRPWVKSADYWTVLFDTNKTIKQKFDAEGISIPFPQQDIHLINEK